MCEILKKINTVTRESDLKDLTYLQVMTVAITAGPITCTVHFYSTPPPP